MTKQENGNEKINKILGEISGYFMSQKGLCSEIIMPTEYLIKKARQIEKEIEKAKKQGVEKSIKYLLNNKIIQVYDHDWSALKKLQS